MVIFYLFIFEKKHKTIINKHNANPRPAGERARGARAQRAGTARRACCVQSQNGYGLYNSSNRLGASGWAA